MRIPVVSKSGKPLMPCNSYRAKDLLLKGKAVRKFKKGLYYLQLKYEVEGDGQPVVLAIDPGIKKEGFTVKSEKHTFLNIQADAATWVREAEETSTMMRRSRRQRKTPCRKPRFNRSRGGIPPSTRARWDLKLRIAKLLCTLYPVSFFIVEDVKAKTIKGKRRWNASFSPHLALVEGDKPPLL